MVEVKDFSNFADVVVVVVDMIGGVEAAAGAAVLAEAAPVDTGRKPIVLPLFIHADLLCAPECVLMECITLQESIFTPSILLF